MNRRGFLAGGALLVWPGWLRHAFAADCDPGALQGLFTAYRRARRAGRPLLVLVVPEDDGAKYDRGHAFGEWLNHGTDEQLAPLAQAEVICASMTDLRALVPHAGEGEPLMIIVPTDRVPARVQPLTAPLPPHAGWEARDQHHPEIDRRIAVLAALAGRALGTPRDVAAAAADVRARLVSGTPAGGRWARGAGCGVTLEEDDVRHMIGCGMGYVPERSRRFLYFFKDQPW
jgi:hypothetical protein